MPTVRLVCQICVWYIHACNNIPQLTIIPITAEKLLDAAEKLLDAETHSGSVEGDSKTFLQGMVTVGLFRRLWVFSGQCFMVCAASPLAPQSGQV